MMEWNNDEINKLLDFIEKRPFTYVVCLFAQAITDVQCEH